MGSKRFPRYAPRLSNKSVKFIRIWQLRYAVVFPYHAHSLIDDFVSNITSGQCKSVENDSPTPSTSKRPSISIFSPVDEELPSSNYTLHSLQEVSL